MPDYKASWRARTRLWAIDTLGGHCVRCGATEDLDFDHVDAKTKSFEISVGIRDGYGRGRLREELSKCQLLCDPCHRQKTNEFLDGGRVEHGGGKSGKHNCPCTPCKTRKAEYMRGYNRPL